MAVLLFLFVLSTLVFFVGPNFISEILYRSDGISYDGRIVKRYRLRFLLQELELQGSEVVIGRSPECSITIEDPLVSRRHAIIRLGSESAILEDLGSRNGVKVNGKPIDRMTELQDGDRIRVGSQDLIFSVAVKEATTGRPTGFIRMCPSCGRAYPDKASSCPHCGYKASGGARALDDDTASGAGLGPRRTWTIQLLGEVLERALESQKGSEAERLMRRAADEVNARMRDGEKLPPNHAHMVTMFAIRVAALQQAPDWAMWALDVYLAHFLIPEPAALQLLTLLVQRDEPRFEELRNKIKLFASTIRSNDSKESAGAFSALDDVVRLL